MAKKKKRARELDERELHESRRYGFFWYDWIWKLLRPVLVFAASFVIVCGLVYTGYCKIDEMFFAPVDAQDAQTQPFSVATGSSLSTVAKNLEEAGLIHNHTVFKYMADFMGKGQVIQSGDYELSRAMSATVILDQLGQGQAVLVEVPVGFRRQGAQADGLVFAGFAFGLALGHFIHVESQAHSCGNGIVVGVLVTHDDDGFCHVFSFVSLGEGAIGALPFFAILRF